MAVATVCVQAVHLANTKMVKVKRNAKIVPSIRIQMNKANPPKQIVRLARKIVPLAVLQETAMHPIACAKEPITIKTTTSANYVLSARIAPSTTVYNLKNYLLCLDTIAQVLPVTNSFRAEKHILD